MKQYTDQMHRTIRCVENPQRIVSLVPSQTELLYTLGLDDRVSGITKFCIHPDHWYQDKPRVGGTKNVDHEKVKTLHPDLIIANKEENTKKDIEVLAQNFPVWVSEIYNLEDAYQMIRSIGYITNTQTKAQNIIASTREKFEQLSLDYKGTALYAIWRNPWMFAGQDVFINTILEKGGFQNILNDPKLLQQLASPNKRYPAIKENELQKLSPDYVFLSSEPYPFKEKHVSEIASLFPDAKIILVDGEMFTWYGSRLLETPGYLKTLSQQV